MTDKLKWGILATGRIAGNFVKGVAHSHAGQVVAVGSRSQEKADKFAAEHNIARRHGSYQALLADPEVQAVYLATPHPMHAEWAIKAAEAGKHILCEKPMGINHAEAMAIVQAARDNNVFLMEAYMYRCAPQTAKLVELIRSGIIGQVRVIRAAFSFHAGFNPEGRLFSNAMAGGGILDVGGYCTSMCRLIAGAAQGKDFVDPTALTGGGHIGQSGVDELAVATMTFPGGILAYLSTGISANQDNAVQVFGSEGNILVSTPWIVSREGGTTEIVVKVNKDKEPQRIAVQTGEWLYGLEADHVAANIARRQAPAMSWGDSLGNAKAMDAWRASFGLVYEAEKPENVPTVCRRPLNVKRDHGMKFGRIAGVDKPISRLVMGCDNQVTMPHAAVMYDDFFQHGGNAFDTAYVYCGAKSEKLLGQWIRNRNIREQVVIIDKGSHTPWCTPKDLVRQFNESLERLGADYVDIYMMHRDNLDVPVGEFVDAMAGLQRAGKMRIFGASNWTRERFTAANAYARSKGITGLSVLSNNFSLAEALDVPWGGCLSCSGKAWREWLDANKVPVLSWSSQARGFFTSRSRPDDRSDAEMVRCWYSEDNFQRKARAVELAAKLGVDPVAVALAWVLHQQFPTFALIGPRTLPETRSSWAGLAIELTPEQTAWLNLEA